MSTRRRDRQILGGGARYPGAMVVRIDCRHYSSRSTPAGIIEKCRLDMAQVIPFDCPDNCIFFEPRAISGVGWAVEDPENGDAT